MQWKYSAGNTECLADRRLSAAYKSEGILQITGRNNIRALLTQPRIFVWQIFIEKYKRKKPDNIYYRTLRIYARSIEERGIASQEQTVRTHFVR